MNATDALVRALLKALLYASIALSAVMLGVSGVDTSALRDGHPVRCVDTAGRPGYWDCQLHRRVIPNLLGAAGTAALTGT